MHIGLLIYGSLATISGGYLYDRQLVHCLRTAGHTVEIIALPWRNYGRHLTDNFSRPLLAHLRTKPFDLLLQDELNHPSLAWLNGRLRRNVHYPVVSIVHHLRSSETHPRILLPLYYQVEQHYLNNVDGFIYNSQTTCATVAALLRKSTPHIVAYPAADHRQPPATVELRQDLAVRLQKQGPLQLLFVGSVIERKGLHTLLQALAQLPAAHWHLHVAGSLATDVHYVAYIQQLMHRTSLTTNVTLYGACTDHQINTLYRQCHLYAAPAFEGFGIAYLEAMSFGLPVIAATTGAAHEIVTHEVDGFLVAPDDIATLAHYIDLLAVDRARLQSMSQAARQRYDHHPTWQASFAPVLPWLEGFGR
ncbi:MAG: glycosyltransferase family 4 protein [Caldilineaceae bacterium]